MKKLVMMMVMMAFFINFNNLFATTCAEAKELMEETVMSKAEMQAVCKKEKRIKKEVVRIKKKRKSEKKKNLKKKVKKNQTSSKEIKSLEKNVEDLMIKVFGPEKKTGSVTLKESGDQTKDILMGTLMNILYWILGIVLIPTLIFLIYFFYWRKKNIKEEMKDTSKIIQALTEVLLEKELVSEDELLLKLNPPKKKSPSKEEGEENV